MEHVRIRQKDVGLGAQPLAVFHGSVAVKGRGADEAQGLASAYEEAQSAALVLRQGLGGEEEERPPSPSALEKRRDRRQVEHERLAAERGPFSPQTSLTTGAASTGERECVALPPSATDAPRGRRGDHDMASALVERLDRLHLMGVQARDAIG